MKQKITGWLIIAGKPIYGGKSRQLARTKIKILRKTEPLRYNEFLYIGKVIDDPKRRGHGKIILEY